MGLNEMKGTYMNNKKNSGCLDLYVFFLFQYFLEKAKVEIRNLFRFKSFKVGKKISRSLSPEISMLRRSLKVNLFFKSRILRAGSLFFPKSEGWFFIWLFFIGPMGSPQGGGGLHLQLA